MIKRAKIRGGGGPRAIIVTRPVNRLSSFPVACILPLICDLMLKLTTNSMFFSSNFLLLGVMSKSCSQFQLGCRLIGITRWGVCRCLLILQPISSFHCAATCRCGRSSTSSGGVQVALQGPAGCHPGLPHCHVGKTHHFHGCPPTSWNSTAFDP